MSDTLKSLFADPAPEPRDRHEGAAQIEVDARLLPHDGPVGALVLAIDADLRTLFAAGEAGPDAIEVLAPHGREAHRLTGSVRGMRAILQKAASLNRRKAEARRDMLDKAWHGIGDENGCWTA